MNLGAQLRDRWLLRFTWHENQYQRTARKRNRLRLATKNIKENIFEKDAQK